MNQWMDDMVVESTRPYLWMGEDQDAHVRSYRLRENAEDHRRFLHAHQKPSLTQMVQLQNQAMTPFQFQQDMNRSSSGRLLGDLLNGASIFIR